MNQGKITPNFNTQCSKLRWLRNSLLLGIVLEPFQCLRIFYIAIKIDAAIAGRSSEEGVLINV